MNVHLCDGANFVPIYGPSLESVVVVSMRVRPMNSTRESTISSRKVKSLDGCMYELTSVWKLFKLKL